MMIHPLNKYFDHIFVISIDRNKKRLESFLRQNNGINIEVFQGFDGKKIYPEIESISQFPSSFFIKHNLNFERAIYWNKSQLGCAMSHYYLQKEIVKRKLFKTLILEDDAIIVKENIQSFVQSCNEIPESWELFYLGYNPVSRWSENKFTRQILRVKHLIYPVSPDGLTSGSLSNRFFSVSFSPLLNLPGVYGGAHAYALSYEGALKILNIDNPLSLGADTTMMYANYYRLINGFSLKKRLFIPDVVFPTSLVS